MTTIPTTNFNAPTSHLLLTFNLPIYPRQIKNWRGAFIQMAGQTNDLFHNHNNQNGNKSSTTYHHRYPLIHYRINNGNAAILAINEGVDALQQVLSEQEWQINWEGKTRQLQVFDMRMNQHYLRMTPTPKTYRLFNYLAFNADNYQRWQQADNYIQRIQLLQEILTGQLLGYATAMNWKIPEHLEVNIQYVQQMKQVKLHGTPRMAFNLTYTCNLLLPEGIALGKGISHGYGWQKNIKQSKQKVKTMEQELYEINTQ